MAARNPTSFTLFPDEVSLVPGKPIIFTPFDQVLNDMEFLLDMEKLLLSDCWHPSDAANAAEVVYYCRSKDMCDVSGVTNDEISHEVTFLIWAESGSTCQVDMTSTATANNTCSASTTATSPTWSAYQTINIKTNDNEDTLTFDVKRPAGSGDVYWGGIGIFALET